MDEEEREILELTVDRFNLEEFMESHRALMVAEIISATEELIYKDLPFIEVIRININMSNGKKVVKCSLEKNAAIDGLDTLLEWSLENEEYEHCQRIKLINEYLETKKNDTRPKTTKRARKTK